MSVRRDAATGPTWFDEARLGMFVHWDHASQRGLEVSWPLVGGVFSLPACQDVPAAEYHALASTFDPVDFDAAALARTARRVGMGYVTITTRHHSGFAMWDTDTTDHSVMSTPGRRDLVRETVDAVRSEGLRVGFYYSLSDWRHPDYPAWTDDMRPYVFGQSPPMPTDVQAERFRNHLRAQLDELLSDYGPIDLLWLDGAWERPAAWWRPDELAGRIRRLQPDILLNDRLPGQGDFATPEQFVPPHPPGHRWETCMTMNESWGWNPDDTEYKSARDIVRALCETAGRGGNLLLNVSPRGDGALPPEQTERLDALGAWMSRNHEAIRGTHAGLEPWQFYGPSTRGDGAVHLFLLGHPPGSITVRGMPVRRVRRARELATGRELGLRTRTAILDMLADDPDGEVTIDVPDEVLDDLVTVVTIDVDEEGSA